MTEWLLSIFSWLPTDNSYYLIIFAVTFLESLAVIGLVIPGSTLAVIAGFLAYHGHGDIVTLAIASAIGSAFGDGCSYFIGRRYGNSISQLKFISRYRKTLDRGKVFFDDHGFKSVIFARFIGFFRPFIPFIAGWMKMPTPLFALYATISCIFWGIAYPGLGYLFGESWHMVTIWSGRFGILIGILLFTVLASHIFWRIFVPEGRRLFHHYSDNKKGIISAAKLSFILSAITIGATIGLSWIVIWYREHVQDGGIDQLLYNSFKKLPPTEFDRFFWLVSGLGTYSIIGGCILIISGYLIFKDETKEALLLISLLLAGAIATNLFNHGGSNTLPPSYIFPTATAQRSASIQLFLGMYLYPLATWLASHLLKGDWHQRLVTLSSTLPIGIFISRLYLGLDLITDLIIGIIIGIGGFFLFLAINPAIPQISPCFSFNQKRSVGILLFILGIGWLSIATYTHWRQTPVRIISDGGNLARVSSMILPEESRRPIDRHTNKDCTAK